MNLPKSGSAFFHEAGHAHNLFKSNKLGQFFTKISKPLNIPYLKKMKIPVLILSAAVVGLATNKKEEKPKSIFGKAAQFIKNNPFKTSLAIFSPILIEEARASIKANNIAKKMLSPEKLKKMNKSNLWAFMTYVNTSLFIGLILYTVNKVRDKVAQL